MIETPIHKNIREELEARRKGLAQEQASPTADTANTLVYSKEDINARTTFARMLSLGAGTGNANYTAIYGGTFFTNALGPDPLGTNDRLDPTINYNFDENKGLVAQPGINQVQSEYLGEGAVMATKKKTTVNFTCFSLTDLTIMMHEFMIPGTEILVDFGWVNPKRANEMSEGSFIELLNSGITLKEGTNFFDYFQSFDKIFESYGNIETCIGRVTEYGFSVKDDGSFDCTISLISSGISFYTNDIATEEHPVAFVAQSQEAQEEFKKLQKDVPKEEREKLAPDVVPVDLINYISTMRSQIIGSSDLHIYMPRAFDSTDNGDVSNWQKFPYHGGNIQRYAVAGEKQTQYTTYSSGLSKKAYNFNNHMCHIVGGPDWDTTGKKAGWIALSELVPKDGFKDLDDLFFNETAGICAKNPGWIGNVPTNGVDEFYKYGFLMDASRDFIYVFVPYPTGIYKNQNDFRGLPYFVHIYMRLGYFEDNVLSKFAGVIQDNGDTYSFRSLTPVPTDTVNEDLGSPTFKEEFLKTPEKMNEVKEHKTYKFVNEPTRMVTSDYPYPKEMDKILINPNGDEANTFLRLSAISDTLEEEGKAGELTNVSSVEFYRNLQYFLGGAGTLIEGGSRVSAVNTYKIKNPETEKEESYAGAKRFFCEKTATGGGYIRNMYINLDIYQESFCGASNREFFYRPNHHEILKEAPDFNRSAAVSSIDEGIKNLLDVITDQFNGYNSFKIQSNPVYPNITGIVDTNFTNPGDDIFTVKAFKKDSLTTALSFDYNIPPNVQKAAIFGAGLSGQDSLAFGSFPKSEQKDLIAIMEFKETLKTALNKKEDNLVSSKSIPFTKYSNFGSVDLNIDDKKNLLEKIQGSEVFNYISKQINVIEPYQLSQTSDKAPNFNSVYMSPQVMYSALLKDSDVPDSEKKITNQTSALTSITLADFQNALDTSDGSTDSKKDLNKAPAPFIPSKLIQTLAQSDVQSEGALKSISDAENDTEENLRDITSGQRFRFFTYEKVKHDNLQNNLPTMRMAGNLQQMYDHLHLSNQLAGKRNPHFALPGMLKISITLHGISGILPGNKFKVDYLPTTLAETTYFLCTAVSQDLTADGWTTTIEAFLRKDPRKVATTPVTYTLNVNNIYKGEAIEPVVRPSIPVPSDDEDILDDVELEPLDFTDIFEDTLRPYSVEFDTEHQFQRPIEPVAPNSIADSSQTAYYNITVDPYNPGASSYGFGQTDILTQDDYDALVSFYSNVEEYKEHVDFDEYGNELDARTQIEMWLDERYEVFTITDMSVGTNIGASDEFARDAKEESEYDKFGGFMRVYVKKDPPGSSTINSTLSKILKLSDDLRKFNERENERRADFVADDPMGTTIVEDTNREYLDDALKLFLSKDRNLINLIHPSIINTPARPDTPAPGDTEDIIEVNEEDLNAETDALDEEFDALLNEEVILPKPEPKVGNIKISRSFSQEFYIARARIGPLGVWYWEPGAYLVFLDPSGNPIQDISTERRQEEAERFLRNNIMIPRPGWYYTAVTHSDAPDYRGQGHYANGYAGNADDPNFVMLFGQNPKITGRGYVAKYEQRSVPLKGVYRGLDRVPMADVNGKGMDIGPGPHQWQADANKLQKSVNENIEACNYYNAKNMKQANNRGRGFGLNSEQYQIFQHSPYYKYSNNLSIYNDPGQTPFYQESIDAALIMGNVISRADFATKNKLVKPR